MKSKRNWVNPEGEKRRTRRTGYYTIITPTRHRTPAFRSIWRISVTVRVAESGKIRCKMTCRKGEGRKKSENNQQTQELRESGEPTLCLFPSSPASDLRISTFAQPEIIQSPLLLLVHLPSLLSSPSLFAMARLLRAPFRLRLHTLAVPSAPALCRRSYSTPTSNNSDNTIATSTTITAEAKTTAPSPVPNSTTSPASRDDQWQGINLLQDAIEFQLGPSKKFKVPFTLLRDACKCPLCVDTHSKQRNFRSSDIPHNITPKSVKWDSNQLETKWNHDIEGFDESHASKYTLRELQYPQVYGQFSSLGRKRPRTLWNRDIMNKHQHWISFDSYINDDEKFTSAMRALATWGLVFVSDIPESREMVEKIATRMGPIRNTFYGATWDVRKVPEARNVAYTNKFLGFHMDLMYMNEPPGFQLLHCIHNSCEGGESLFADTFKVARDLSVHQPDVFQRLTKTHLRYQYIHEDHHYNNTWPVFSTYEDTQVPGDHGLFHVNYSPPFQGPGHWGVPYGDSKGVQRRIADLKTFASRLEEEENTFELKLNPGECVIFENRRIVHARRQFNTNSGERWLAGTYVDEDAIMSRWRMLRNHYPEVWDYESEDVKALNMSQRKRRGEGHHSPSVDN